VPEWRLDLACAPETIEDSELLAQLKSLPNVRWHGIVTRPVLADLMGEADIFVFPSLAEGSARVVFEAIATGCHVITTPNSGSIIGREAEGDLIEPDADSLLVAILKALQATPESMAATSVRNMNLARANYRQSDYARRVLEIYADMLR